jgi:hypothetical protein
MKSEQGGNRWRGVRSLALSVGVCFFAGCAMDAVTGTGDEQPLFAANAANTTKATGLVEIIWPKSLKQEVPEGEEKLAFVELTAFPATADNPVRGSFTFRVLNLDSTLHREIVAELTGVVVDPDVRKSWYVGTVVSDERICSGGCGGHDDGGTHDDGGCSHDDGGTDDGGCSHDDGGTDDGGCSHDDGGTDDGSTHDDGGCSGGGSDGGMGGPGGDTGGPGGDSHDDGGCSHDDGGTDDGGCSHDDGGTDDGGCSHDDGGTDDGGCSHDDGSTDDGGCSGGGSSGGHGQYHVSGKDPRVGQIIVGKLHDGGTPGVDNDGITWKWFHPDNPNLPSIENTADWPHLCKKWIIGGNLTIHPKP